MTDDTILELARLYRAVEAKVTRDQRGDLFEQESEMPTPPEIRANYLAHNHGHFFDRATMKFFGDTMKSFGVRVIDGVTYLYRKPSARVNVCGRWTTAGREFFGAWRVDESGDVHGVYDDTAKQAIYERVEPSTGRTRR